LRFRAWPEPRAEANGNTHSIPTCGAQTCPFTRSGEFAMTYWIWLIIAFVFVIIEVNSLAFYALFAAIGAGAASLTAAFTGEIGIQIAVFAAVSLAGVTMVRRLVTGALSDGNRPSLVSGAAGMVGQHATVVRQVKGPHHPGTVHARGEDWPAISYEEEALEPGEVVLVVELDRTRLVVMST
jgi:membrane protein implicated in regulation of membrane protease activity